MKASQDSKESDAAGDALTPKHEVFVAEYLKTGNATEAYLQAGYKSSSKEAAAAAASRLLKTDKVARACAREQVARSERLHLEEDYELSKSIEIVERCLSPEVCDFKNANMAIANIAKLRGKFVNKVEVGFADNLAAQLEAIVE